MNNDHFTMLTRSVSEWNQWRVTNLSGANLNGVNLSGAYLSDADLSDANLNGVNLNGAYLSGVNLSRTNLSRTNLSGANLSGVSLRGVNLSRANLSGANLNGVNLSGAYLSGAKIDDYTIINLAARATRSDGYEFFGWLTDKGLLIRAGCQTKLLAEYRAHVLTYTDDAKIKETTRILDYIEGSI